MSSYTQKEVFQMPVEQLIPYLSKVCKVETPAQVETIEDMQKASKLLGHIGPIYAWLTQMETLASIQKRVYKGKEKELYEEFIMKEQVFASFAKQMNILYNTVSRMITIKQQINQELRMTGNLI